MIQHLEILRYRCHRFVSASLSPFQVLVGPTGSGKTTFLDAIRFLSDLVSLGMEEAVGRRTDTFEDLVWGRRKDRLELAIECTLPQDLQQRFEGDGYTLCRYELSLGRDPESDRPGVLAEKLLLMDRSRRQSEEAQQQPLFHLDGPTPDGLMTARGLRGTKTVVHKLPGSNDKFYDETGDGWDLSFRLGPNRLALASIPEEEDRFPASRWLRDLLTRSVQTVSPNLAAMCRPLPPGLEEQSQFLLPDGSNIAAVAGRLEQTLLEQMDAWVSRLQEVEPDLVGIRVAERPHDYARFLILRFKGGLDVPVWSAADGLLRLMTMTLPSFAPPPQGIRLIESPEVGLHPSALPLLAQALTSTPDVQQFVTTYSPGLLEHLGRERALFFARDDAGVSAIRNAEHAEPAEREAFGLNQP